MNNTTTLTTHEAIIALWPETGWISNHALRQQTIDTWALALSKSTLTSSDLHHIPFTLLCGPHLQVSFMDHKRSVVHIARNAGETINAMYHGELKVDMDTLIAGAILADVGKLLEYTLDENKKPVQANYGKYLRHPFSGVSLAEACGVPPSVCHIIATHAGEGEMVKRTTEATIVHHADFMTFIPFKERLKI